MTVAQLDYSLSESRTNTHVKVWIPNGVERYNYDFVTTHGYERKYVSATINSDGFHPTNWKVLKQTSTISDHTNEHDSLEYRYTDDMSRSYLPGGSLITANVGASQGFTTVFSGNVLNMVKTEALAKMADGKVNLGITTAEVGKTASSIVKASRLLVDVGLAIKRRDRVALDRLNKIIFSNKSQRKAELQNNYKKFSDTASNLWLNNKYVVEQAVNDIAGLVDIHNNGLGDASKLEIVSVRRQTRKDAATKGSNTTVKTVEKSKVVYECKLRASINDADKHAMKVLGLTSPAQVAWEVIPYSFVADWLIPIGTWLQALNAPAGLTFEMGKVSIRGSLSGTLYWDQGPVCGTGGCSFAAPCTYTEELFERTTLGTFPTPLLYAKNPFSSSHVTSTLALFPKLRK